MSDDEMIDETEQTEDVGPMDENVALASTMIDNFSGKSTSRQQQMLESAEPGRLEFPCSQCFKTFKTKMALVAHARRHSTKQRDVDSQPNAAGVHKYICKGLGCGKDFTYHRSYIKHCSSCKKYADFTKSQEVKNKKLLEIAQISQVVGDVPMENDGDDDDVKPVVKPAAEVKVKQVKAAKAVTKPVVEPPESPPASPVTKEPSPRSKGLVPFGKIKLLVKPGGKKIDEAEKPVKELVQRVQRVKESLTTRPTLAKVSSASPRKNPGPKKPGQDVDSKSTRMGNSKGETAESEKPRTQLKSMTHKPSTAIKPVKASSSSLKIDDANLSEDENDDQNDDENENDSDNDNVNLKTSASRREKPKRLASKASPTISTQIGTLQPANTTLRQRPAPFSIPDIRDIVDNNSDYDDDHSPDVPYDIPELRPESASRDSWIHPASIPSSLDLQSHLFSGSSETDFLDSPSSPFGKVEPLNLNSLNPLTKFEHKWPLTNKQPLRVEQTPVAATSRKPTEDPSIRLDTRMKPVPTTLENATTVRKSARSPRTRAPLPDLFSHTLYPEMVDFGETRNTLNSPMDSKIDAYIKKHNL